MVVPVGIAKNHEHLQGILSCTVLLTMSVVYIISVSVVCYKGINNWTESVNNMPAVSSVHDREHQTDDLLIFFCVLLRATKVSHRYKIINTLI